jgi:hypothetical protein
MWRKIGRAAWTLGGRLEAALCRVPRAAQAVLTIGIARADVAAFMLGEALEPAHARAMPIVSTA